MKLNQNTIILVILPIIFLSLNFLYQKFAPEPSSTLPQSTSEEIQAESAAETCLKDEDCALSGNLPSEMGLCVNKDWFKEWNKDPESKKYIRDCAVGPMCGGIQFIANGMKRPKNGCQCINNSCQIADLTNYPGCRMASCK